MTIPRMIPRLLEELEDVAGDTGVLVVLAVAEPEIIWQPFTEAPLLMALLSAAATDSVLVGVDDDIRAVAIEDP